MVYFGEIVPFMYVVGIKTEVQCPDCTRFDLPCYMLKDFLGLEDQEPVRLQYRVRSCGCQMGFA